MNTIKHFNKMITEHNEFIHDLAEELALPESEDKVNLILRAVLHTLRQRLTIQQSFHILAQLPLSLKLYYIEEWKYLDKPIKYNTIEGFSDAVKAQQYHLGERNFDWEKPTAEITNIVLASLKKYLDEGTMQNIFAEVPVALHSLFI
jgi:uncharacterized protein (DUF2267 family)